MSSGSDWDAFKRHHRFIRSEDTDSDMSREEKLVRDYESKLFKEFALIDLKHFKTKVLALRWRTATEVVRGLGEETCGSLRCQYHSTRNDTDLQSKSTLRTFDLPFAYEEGGHRKEAMVKVRLCTKCSKKLMWKPAAERGPLRRRSLSPRRRQDADVRNSEVSSDRGGSCDKRQRPNVAR